VTREGPNSGRSYLTCIKGKKEFGGCGLFEWVGQTLPSPTKAVNETHLGTCRCGTAIEQKTVTKEGPNSGRSYLACAKGKKEFGGCGLFEWVDQTLPSPTKAGTGTRAVAGERSKTGGVIVAGRECKCGTAVESRTVLKDGPTKGRAYMTCSKGKRDFGGCGFFEWSA